MVEVLSGVLTGAGVGHGIGALYGDAAAAQDVGHVHLALDPGPLVGAAPFAERLGELVASLSASAPGPGSEEVLVPGEPEERAARQRSEHGIPLPPSLWSALRDTGGALGVASPDPG